MAFDIKRIVRGLPLGEYAPEYGDEKLYVWVNPPKAATDARWSQADVAQALNARLTTLLESKADDTTKQVKQIVDELARIGEETTDWLVEVLGQGPEETHLGVDDLKKIFEADPSLYRWILKSAWMMILDYRAGEKKSYSTPLKT